MKRPLIIRRPGRNRERGVTIALVAIAMVAILAMAALSIDAVTLYLAREEAQRAADAAALAGARILSLSGMTGDPTNATNSWIPACNAATTVATAIAQQNQIAGQSLPAAQIAVTFPNNVGCGGSGGVFGINPEVNVKVTRQNLPTFFARIWGYTGNTVVASATAEAYNPSNSASVNANGMVPVQPRCVKPWIIPNKDPALGGTFVNTTNGSISNPGVSQLGRGVIGESFTLTSACKQGAPNCDVTLGNVNPNPSAGQYVPAQVSGTPIATNTNTAISACTNADIFEMAIDGCDQQTQYNCGISNPGMSIDLDIAPVSPTYATGESNTSAQCLVNYGPGGQDTLQTSSYPFQILAGSNNPLAAAGIVNNDNPITTSNSIVSIPIYDSTGVTLFGNHQQVTIVGFLQAFIYNFDLSGNPQVTVLNVSGCSNNAASTGVNGTSPVPVRLVSQ